MTENKRMSISGLLDILDTGISLSTSHIEYAIQSDVLEDLACCLKELEQYRAIGTIEEFNALKEKNTPKELAEHNFQDEPHHYLCPSCRSIVSCTQNYCDECGQVLET